MLCICEQEVLVFESLNKQHVKSKIKKTCVFCGLV